MQVSRSSKKRKIKRSIRKEAIAFYFLMAKKTRTTYSCSNDSSNKSAKMNKINMNINEKTVPKELKIV